MPDSHALSSRLENQIHQGLIKYDPAQAEAIKLLDQVINQLQSSSKKTNGRQSLNKKNDSNLLPFFSLNHWLSGKKSLQKTDNAVKGLYIWGDVGRGKTWLMDQFFDAVDIQDKKRVHYHQFMEEIHRSLASLYAQANPLDLIAERMAEKHRLICLDEFHVMDIADAVILHGLLRELFKQGVTLITTSNRHPDELYKNGTHRERFLPAIELIKQCTTVFELDNGQDYRLNRQHQENVFFTPQAGKSDNNNNNDHDDFNDKINRDENNSISNNALMQLFEKYSNNQQYTNVPIIVYGREIPVVRVASTVIWFDFNTLCRGPRSSNDYIQIARKYKTVILSQVPVLHVGEEAPARRFLNLVDEFYDQHVFLILSSDVILEEIYQGELLAFEFKRALSRLEEMQSRSYWLSSTFSKKEGLMKGLKGD